MVKRINVQTMMFLNSTYLMDIRIPFGEKEYADFKYVTYSEIDVIIEALEGAFLVGEPPVFRARPGRKQSSKNIMARWEKPSPPLDNVDTH